MAASTMKLQSDSFTSEKVSTISYLKDFVIENMENYKTPRLIESSRRNDCGDRGFSTASWKNARHYIFPILCSHVWRSTKERALKRPRTDSLNRKSPSLTTLENRDRRLRRILAHEVASLFNVVFVSAMQRVVI